MHGAEAWIESHENGSDPHEQAILLTEPLAQLTFNPPGL